MWAAGALPGWPASTTMTRRSKGPLLTAPTLLLADRVSSSQVPGALRGARGVCEDRIGRLASAP
jgi:hypothetical protein